MKDEYRTHDYKRILFELQQLYFDWSLDLPKPFDVKTYRSNAKSVAKDTISFFTYHSLYKKRCIGILTNLFINRAKNDTLSKDWGPHIWLPKSSKILIKIFSFNKCHIFIRKKYFHSINVIFLFAKIYFIP